MAEGAARVPACCKEPWAREAIEESFIGDAVKAELRWDNKLFARHYGEFVTDCNMKWVAGPLSCRSHFVKKISLFF
ncbi:MAG: hypothetical protein HYV06_01860 [Deltaproteobacteria bacterium]|nr:hypothetical protein [Deltaproteobacteria bacterium]